MKFNPAPMKKTLLILVVLLILQLLTNWVGKPYWINITESEPLGLYRMKKLERPPRRGEMVFLTVPETYHQYVYGRKWLPAGIPLLKHVGAVPGDFFCSQDSSFAINGTVTGPVYRTDETGLPLPHLEGCQQIIEGQFLPVAVHIKRSFDGRYMGPVPVTRILGLASPIWVLP
jgi:conjugative transfer signal peptidase TraF